jgi:hypothetical protein
MEEPIITLLKGTRPVIDLQIWPVAASRLKTISCSAMLKHSAKVAHPQSWCFFTSLFAYESRKIAARYERLSNNICNFNEIKQG